MVRSDCLLPVVNDDFLAAVYAVDASLRPANWSVSIFSHVMNFDMGPFLDSSCM